MSRSGSSSSSQDSSESSESSEGPNSLKRPREDDESSQASFLRTGQASKLMKKLADTHVVTRQIEISSSEEDDSSSSSEGDESVDSSAEDDNLDESEQLANLKVKEESMKESTFDIKGAKRKSKKARDGESRNADEHCYACGAQNADHTSKNCPNPASKNPDHFRLCYKCGKKGHKPRGCSVIRDRKKAEKIRLQTTECHHCHNTGHISRNCPDRPTLQCFVCKEEGHIGRDCPQNGGIECYKCGQKGHMSGQCPLLKKSMSSRGGRGGGEDRGRGRGDSRGRGRGRGDRGNFEARSRSDRGGRGGRGGSRGGGRGFGNRGRDRGGSDGRRGSDRGRGREGFRGRVRR